MQITDVKVVLNEDSLRDNDCPVLAYAEMTLDKEFVVSGMRVIRGKQRLFVSMPSYKFADRNRDNGEERWHDICFPIKKQARERIEKRILYHYHQACEKAKNKANTAEQQESQESQEN